MVTPSITKLDGISKFDFAVEKVISFASFRLLFMQRFRQGSGLHHHEDEIMQFLYVKSSGDRNGEAKEGPGAPFSEQRKQVHFEETYKVSVCLYWLQRIRQGSGLHHHEDEIMQFL